MVLVPEVCEKNDSVACEDKGSARGATRRPDSRERALNPPQPVSTEDVSGDTIVLSDDDHDTLTSKLKFVDSFREGEKCNLMVPSLPFSRPEVMLMSTHTLEDLIPL